MSFQLDITPCCNGDERSQLEHGTTTLADVEETCRQAAGQLGLEGQWINGLHECGAEVKVGNSIGSGYNPGAHAHTSVHYTTRSKAPACL